MSLAGSVSVSALLGTLTAELAPAEGAIVASIAGFSASELLKLALEEIQQISASIRHFIANLRAGRTWGEAMASMLTEVWNDTQSDLAGLATDFVEAVGRVFESVGLIPAQA